MMNGLIVDNMIRFPPGYTLTGCDNCHEYPGWMVTGVDEVDDGHSPFIPGINGIHVQQRVAILNNNSVSPDTATCSLCRIPLLAAPSTTNLRLIRRGGTSG